MTKKTRTKAEDASEQPRTSLPQICSEAADHVARARIALYDDTLDADQALIHLDEAIACLKRLWAHGSAPRTTQHPNLRSA
jgi:hypothetical protein